MSNRGYADRFGGVGRLYSEEGLLRLKQAHVCIVGVGGVGSWAAEALARSGLGRITLIDSDEVCITNINRQLHALDADIGRSKVDVMAERISRINPECTVTALNRFFVPGTAEDILALNPDCFIDAIDNLPNKALLLARCRDLKIPVFSSGGAGGRRDPSQIQVADLAKTHGDPLLASLRKQLRANYRFPRDPRRKFGITCVFSAEPLHFPWKNGEVCSSKEAGESLRLNCQSGFGTASFVTGTFGFQLAACAVERLANI
ncbi:MAG: tRNA cyclic N6-threonylcarbamoyladenosine(37) synthase TcdA [Opitutales bacterium]|nr:tRNA cyclic N6-threonylcarbamoyladenosine(37) synthase TcdA [Opitutales bacterium]